MAPIRWAFGAVPPTTEMYLVFGEEGGSVAKTGIWGFFGAGAH